MQFRVLGNLEVRDAEPLPALRPRQERFLARLLLSPNAIVQIGTLAEAMWEAEPPPSAERQVQNAASQLRQAWQQAGIADAKRVITTERSGYRLHIDQDELDILVHRRLVARAVTLQESGRRDEAITTLRRALSLWRGSAFAGINSRIIESNAVLINEERPAALETCIRLELEMGRHARVVGELVRLVAEFPYREQLTELLIVALYRTGRQMDALQAYHDMRTRLNREAGIDPGPDLQQLYQRILRNDPTLSPPAPPDPRASRVSALHSPLPQQVPIGRPFHRSRL